MEIEGSVCIVTGASSGIGAATARALAARGAPVVLAARRAERLESLAAELPDALAVATDVTDAAALRRLADAALDTYGRIDVLVNNAGQGLHVPVAQLAADDLRAVFDLNVVAPVLAMEAVLPAMLEEGRGAVVNVSSGTSLRAIPGVGGYAATKAALNMVSDVARLELAGGGVRVSVVYPSITATEFHERLRAGTLAPGARSITPDPPELAARAIVFAVETGTAHVAVGDPPRALEPSTSPAMDVP
jgi:NADP-dependent 3-hydroxy acid dehydrogenase YdfG